MSLISWIRHPPPLPPTSDEEIDNHLRAINALADVAVSAAEKLFAIAQRLEQDLTRRRP